MVEPPRHTDAREGADLTDASNPDRDAGAIWRYAAAGVGSFVVDFAAFAGLVHVGGVDPLWAHAVSRPLGGLACWWLNRRFTFRSAGRVPGELLRFALVFGASFTLTEGLLALFCRGLDLAPLVGKVLAEAVAFLFNFLALKHFTFRRDSRA